MSLLLSYSSANPHNAKAKAGMVQVEKILSGGDEDEEDEAEVSENQDEQDIEAMDADPDQHGHMTSNLDEGGVQIGEVEPPDDMEQLLQLHRRPRLPQTLYRSTAGGTFDHTQQQRPPPTPQLPPRRIATAMTAAMAAASLAGSLTPGSGSILNSPALGHRHGTLRPPNLHVSQRERELDEFEDGGEEMDE